MNEMSSLVINFFEWLKVVTRAHLYSFTRASHRRSSRIRKLYRLHKYSLVEAKHKYSRSQFQYRHNIYGETVIV